MKRLQQSTVSDVASTVRLPRYERERLRPGIVHLGIGAFHRAHQAVYTEDALELAGGGWGIIGVSLRSAQVAEQLLPQQCLYSVLSEDAQQHSLRVIGAVQNVLVAPEDPAAVAAAIADPAIAIVTLTITEKGYALAADGAALDRDDLAIRADIATPERPTTALGLLALGLRERLAAGGAPLTVLSCDNLSENSRRLQGVLREYLGATFSDVLPWLDDAVRFPCSMIDRIVPAMTAERRARQAERLGLVDEAAVSTEPFMQWLIENNFAASRPVWDRVGAQFVDDIRPYETIKLRLLNAAHLAIAYCGLLSGCETVDEVMADAALRTFVERLMSEDLMPALEVPPGFSVAEYRDALLARFANPCLSHRCAQIAMDGSEKIAQRWLPGLTAVQPELLLRAVSAWCYFVLCTDLDIDDPKAPVLIGARGSAATLSERIAKVLACARIASDSVRDIEGIVAAVARNIARLRDNGIEAFLSAPSNPAGS